MYSVGRNNKLADRKMKDKQRLYMGTYTIFVFKKMALALFYINTL